jgi:hypothetical protein
MLLDQLQAQMRTLPEAAGWPEMMTVFDHTQDTPHPDWELPLRVCEAVGGDPAHGCSRGCGRRLSPNQHHPG